jgi:hypothetical protein
MVHEPDIAPPLPITTEGVQPGGLGGEHTGVHDVVALLLNIELITVPDPDIAPPSPVAVLLLKVELVTVPPPYIAPPLVAVLLLKVELVTVPLPYLAPPRPGI